MVVSSELSQSPGFGGRLAGGHSGTPRPAEYNDRISKSSPTTPVQRIPGSHSLDRILKDFTDITILTVTSGQIFYEWDHFKKKLKKKDQKHLASLREIEFPESHPLFVVITGNIEKWEKVWTSPWKKLEVVFFHYILIVFFRHRYQIRTRNGIKE